MRLRNIALLALRGCDTDVINRIAGALDASPKSVYRWIQNNDDNLTKAAAMKVIREALNLSDEEILEDITDKSSQN